MNSQKKNKTEIHRNELGTFLLIPLNKHYNMVYLKCIKDRILFLDLYDNQLIYSKNTSLVIFYLKLYI